MSITPHTFLLQSAAILALLTARSELPGKEFASLTQMNADIQIELPLTADKQPVAVKNEPLVLTEKQRRNFDRKVDKSGGLNGCWVWTGTKTEFGYGHFCVNGKLQKVHRVAFAISSGFPVKPMQVLHRCDNPPCCNPSHLFIGTQKQNVDDMTKKGRQRQPKGEQAHLSKLHNGDIVKIRRMYASGEYSTPQLGAIFGVQYSTILHIIHRRTWKHIS